MKRRIIHTIQAQHLLHVLLALGFILALALPTLAAPLRQNGGTLQVDVSSNGSWVGGFNGALKITNSGTETVNGWTLVFVLNGATIDSAWSGQLSTDAQGRYVLTNESWNGTIAPGAAVQAGFSATGSFNGLSYCTINGQSCGMTLATPTPTLPPGPVVAPAWPARVFAPYVDAAGWPPPEFTQWSQTLGTKFFVAAFVVTDGTTACKPTWGGYSTYPASGPTPYLGEDIKTLRRSGGDIMVSFGGAANTELAGSCPDVASLKAQYQAVIDAYSLTYIDFDIEGQWVAHQPSIERRSQAIAALQADARAAGKELQVWYTLPVLPTGLDNNGRNVLNAALTYGVDLAGVNIMAMDYGGSAAPDPSAMGKYAIDAATNLFNQMKSAYATHQIAKSDAELWRMVGVTPMIGGNDVMPEMFDLEDAQQLLTFAQQKDIGLLSMWSLNRDKQCAKTPAYGDPTCSGTAQDAFAFTNLFKPYTSGVSPTPTPTATLPAGITPTATTVPPTATPTQVVPTATPTQVPPTPTPTAITGNTSCQVDYLITSDWGSGFNAHVVISNRSGAPMSSWTLTWTFPGKQKISSLWNGDYKQSGAAVTVTNSSWNGTIANGGSVSVGFGASYTGSNQPPTKFTVNGIACNQSNVQPTPTATPTKPLVTNTPTATKTPTAVPPTATPTATNLPGTPTALPSPTPTATQPPTTADLDKEVIAYFVQWGIYQRNYHVKNIVTSGAADKITILNYAFGNVVNGECIMTTASGVMDAYADYQRSYSSGQSVDGVADTWDQALRGNFNQLKKLKKMYPHLKVLISLGGWTWSNGFHDAAMTDASRQKVVKSCIDLYIRGNLPVADNAGGVGAAAGLFDGIDIDWEHPAANGNNQPYGPEDTQNFTLLLQEFRRQLDAINPKLMLTIATNAGVDKYSLIELAKIHQSLNYINLMSYDFHGTWERTTGHAAPLYPSSTAPYAYPANTYAIDTAVQAFLAGGVPAKKLVVGIPFYGRGWRGVPNINNGLWQVSSGAASGTYEAGVDDYKVIQALNYPVYRDENAAAVWKYNGDSFWSYDDEQTITTKMNYIREHNLGGAMAWSLDGDNGTLLPAMYRGLQNSVAAPITAGKGGAMAFADADGSTSHLVEVPDGAVTDTITLKAQVTPLGDSITIGLQPVGSAFIIDAYQAGERLDSFAFAKPFTVTIQYSDAEIAGLNEADLKLFYFDEASHQWLDAATSCAPTSTYDRRPDANQFAVAICHLTKFGVFTQSAASAAQVYLPLVQR